MPREGRFRNPPAEVVTVCWSTPHATTGVSPAELFLKRKLRTRLDLIFPSLKNNVHGQEERQIGCQKAVLE